MIHSRITRTPPCSAPIASAFSPFSTCYLTAALAIVISLGCGPAEPTEYLIAGVVKCGGKVVPTGVVIFMPTGAGRRASAPIAADGSYSLKAAAGAYKVAVIAPREVATKEVTKENWLEAFQGATASYVPRSVADPETSPIRFTVVPSSENLCNIDIK